MPFNGSFKFDPARTRAAADAISLMFPKKKEPAGLKKLFDMLAYMDLNDVGPWGEKLTSLERDLLCKYYFHAKRPRVALAIAVLLAHVDDPRMTQVAHFFLLLLPEEEDRLQFQQWFTKPEALEAIAGREPIISHYLQEGAAQPFYPYITQRLKSGQISFDALAADFSRELPLFRKLMDFLFRDGGELISIIKPDWASEAVLTYLKDGDDPSVKNYLCHYPEEAWQPEFLDMLQKLKGNPGPLQSAFYNDLKGGVLWKVRRMLFKPRLERMSGDQFEFWNRWLHRITGWREIQTIPHISAHPIKIVEEPDRTLVFFQGDSLNAIEDIERDFRWKKRLETVMQEHHNWGFD